MCVCVSELDYARVGEFDYVCACGCVCEWVWVLVLEPEREGEVGSLIRVKFNTVR